MFRLIRSTEKVEAALIEIRRAGFCKGTQQIQVGRSPQQASGPSLVMPILGSGFQAALKTNIIAAAVQPEIELLPVAKQGFVGHLRHILIFLIGQRHQSRPRRGKPGQHLLHRLRAVLAGD
nr:hypothetical protein [Desulfonatronospira sp.]